MSSVEAKIVRVRVSEHPNADRLAVATIGSEPGHGGFECVVGKAQFSDGDLAIYIMPDSVVPEEMEKRLLEKSKIQISGGRIKAINIRGLLSEGICLVPNEWIDRELSEGDDVTSELGITKYEPQERPKNGLRNATKINFHYQNNNFGKYNCVDKFKKHPRVFSDLEQDVVVTIKMHGTNFRAGVVTKPPCKRNLWENIKRLFVRENPQEFLVGSHNTIKKPTEKASKLNDYKNKDSWRRVAEKYEIEHVVNQIADHEKITSSFSKRPDVVIYGEIIGPNVQKGYDYSIPPGELELRVFDIMIGGKYCDWDKVVHLCDCFSLPTVKEVYRGPWKLELTKMSNAIDVYGGKKFVREGVVIRPLKESWHRKCGRVILKYINEEFLLDKTNSCWH